MKHKYKEKGSEWLYPFIRQTATHKANHITLLDSTSLPTGEFMYQL